MNIESHLEKHTDKLVGELSDLIDRDMPEDVRCIQIMIFRESLPGVPFWVYFLNRFQSSAKGIKPYELLSSLEILIDDEEYVSREDAVCDCLELDGDAEQDFCMASVFERCDIENLLVAKWLARCWHKAGGSNLSIPAFVVEEDFQFNPINLKTGQTIKHMSEYNSVFDG
jgi:hypothetical protein